MAGMKDTAEDKKARFKQGHTYLHPKKRRHKEASRIWNMAMSKNATINLCKTMNYKWNCVWYDNNKSTSP